MLSQTEAIIYLSDQRGCTQSEHYRRFYTFNFENYFTESKKPFGNILVFNDETVGGGHTINYIIAEDTAIILLPLIGGLNLKNNLSEYFIEAGQSAFFFASQGSQFEISNPHKNDLINFLQIRFKTNQSINSKQFEFDLDRKKNKLIPFFPNDECGLIARIGKFDGRQEGTYQLKNSNRPVFIFVIEGVFEVQNRLLQQRDGLALWNIKEVEFEALSSDAIILLLES